MTPSRFKELVADPADGVALRPELAALPLWAEATVDNTLTYADGRRFHERCRATSKTHGGKYIVFSVESQLYKQWMHSILAYDPAEPAYRQWALYGDQLVESTVTFDFANSTSTAASAYGDRFTETSVVQFSTTETSEVARVYKDGALVLTRETKTVPVAPGPRRTSPEESTQP